MDGPAFLGVDSSISGRRWRSRLKDERLALALSQRLGLPEIVGRILAARNVGLDDAPLFLQPTLRELLPDPLHLRDMDRALARLFQAIEKKEKIAVFGDYDVDGATSSALLKRYFAALGIGIRLYIPDRQKEGYGPNPVAIQQLAAEGVHLIITVDCGTMSFTALEAAAQAGVEVIVTDHHKGDAALPKAVAVVNPNRLDETSPHRQLAAVGVVFLLLVGLNRLLREKGWFARQGISQPDLLQWLDLVALGTVCDIVPLTGVNRALVNQGLKVMAQRRNPGIAALADIARLEERPSAWHLGFLLGPRVNAGGRVGQADLGARILSTDNAAEAAEWAALLDQYNLERRFIEAEVLEQAMSLAVASHGRKMIVVAQDNWHPGVIGIVAARLREHFNRPAFVIAIQQGVGKGSGPIGAGRGPGRYGSSRAPS
jgi:single-stranded-DNA-specific exonuclease